MAEDPKKPTIQEVIKEEYKKCYADPIYFIKNYVKIQTQDKGIIPFELFDFQKDLLSSINDNDRIIILKSRQMGISTLIAAYSLWMLIFNEGKNILIVSIKESTAKEIVAKIKLANEKLPSWLKIPTIEDNKHSIRFKNRSMVLATSSASDSTRSFSASFIIFDEAAFIQDIEELWNSAQPTLSTVKNGKAIILSTPNGMGGFFHKTWVEATEKKNGFVYIKLPWNLRPDRDQNWKNKQIKELGIKFFGQEYDCSFLASGNSVVDLMILEEYEKTKMMDPIEMRRGNALWVFDTPKSDRDYVLCADVARGDGSDYSAAHVLDIESLEQVAEFHDFISTKEYGDLLVSLATEYNDALLIVERENIGWAVLQQIIDRQYKNTFYSTSDLKIVEVYRQLSNKYYREDQKLQPGFSTTVATRPLIVSKLEAYFRERAVIIRSCRTITELKTFIWDKGKAQAAVNYHDDLVMSLGLGLWVRDTALRLRQEGILVTKNMLEKIHMPQAEKTPIYTARQVSSGQEAWRMKTGGKPGDYTDLTWLLR